MSHAGSHSTNYIAIWVVLVLLLGAGLALIALPISGVMLVVLIFTVAAVKAALVVRHYMHLRGQPWLIYAIVGVPVVLGIAMVLTLIPDIALR